MKIRWTSLAKQRLKEIRAYIARDSKTHAIATVQRIRAAVHAVRRWPDAGSYVNDEPSSGYREVIVGNYRAIYRVRDNEIQVITVAHAAQDWSPKDLPLS